MYILKHGVKRNPERRWALPDRIFFGHGACAILAGAYLEHPPLEGFYAERILPAEDFSGNHIYVTDGVVAFDYHGYSGRDRLLEHHRKGWASRHPGWQCAIARVEFDLLDTAQLNQRKMLGPDQYLHDPVARACRFLQRVDHREAAARAFAIANGSKPAGAQSAAARLQGALR
ncbi:hypothetical protein [Mesorhizobium sp. B2-3-4]|uniref:hypothetical protein n=1 Tax=Mesorhizobium sp. B2-3-4 TaxID=2589959 RepID=UPI00112ACCD7|nr:hypothetical protein [Mesorhizobium sp. B2-3-4]TPM29304.1 hypothetical protein FJ967_27670 [Mesorhizobium sp. B2-3-4]